SLNKRRRANRGGGARLAAAGHHAFARPCQKSLCGPIGWRLPAGRSPAPRAWLPDRDCRASPKTARPDRRYSARPRLSGHFPEGDSVMVSSVAAGESGGNLRSAETPRTGFFALMLGSIGVVYGDIGTSPLYAVRESVTAAVGSGNPATEEAVLGILSLI